MSKLVLIIVKTCEKLYSAPTKIIFIYLLVLYFFPWKETEFGEPLQLYAIVKHRSKQLLYIVFSFFLSIVRPTPKAQYLYSRHVTPLRSCKLPRLYGKTQKSIQNRPSSECLIRHPTELAIRPNTAHPEVIIDSNNVYVRKQSQGFSGDDDCDLSDCETDLGGMVLFHTLILYSIFTYCSHILN